MQSGRHRRHSVTQRCFDVCPSTEVVNKVVLPRSKARQSLKNGCRRHVSVGQSSEFVSTTDMRLHSHTQCLRPQRCWMRLVRSLELSEPSEVLELPPVPDGWRRSTTSKPQLGRSGTRADLVLQGRWAGEPREKAGNATSRGPENDIGIKRERTLIPDGCRTTVSRCDIPISGPPENKIRPGKSEKAIQHQATLSV